MADASADASADSGTDAPPDSAVPPDGFDRCVTDDGCESGFLCYGSSPGFCAQACDEDSDCRDIQGFDFSCSSGDEACRIDCADDRACPQGLTCVNRGGEQYRCVLPPEEGTGDRELLEPCDRAHGDDDCVDGLVCHRSADSRIDGPGYCTLECSEEDNSGPSCNGMRGSSVDIDCGEGACRIDCTDEPCPLAMACEQIDDRALCHYPRL